MKKIFAMLLVAAMVLSMAACGKTDKKKEVSGDTPVQVLTTVWDGYADNQKFAISGGDWDNSVMDAPGEFDAANAEALDSMLGFPQDKIEAIDAAASFMHMMNANTFTAGAYHVKDAGDVDGVVSALKDNIKNRQWMCGFPDTLLIVKVDANTVVSAFGEATNIENFKTNILAAYEGAEVVVEESLI